MGVKALSAADSERAMREIFSLDQLDEDQPRGAAWPRWINYPRTGPEEWRPLLPGSRPTEFSTLMGEGSGFPRDMPVPILKFNRAIEKNEPLDISIETRGTFAVSDRAKGFFERLDREAFEFVEAKTLLADGEAGPKYWLMDVVRSLNAVDPDQPGAEQLDNGVVLLPPGAQENCFRQNVVRESHVFRSTGGVIVFVDSQFKESFEAAGLSFLSFRKRGVVR